MPTPFTWSPRAGRLYLLTILIIISNYHLAGHWTWFLVQYVLSLIRGLFIWAEVISVSGKTFRQAYTSEISPCYENNMKRCISYIAFISDKRIPVYRDLACWQARYRCTGKTHDTTFPLNGKTFCLHFTKSTLQRKTVPDKPDNISPYEQHKIKYLTCQNFSLNSVHVNRP